MVTINRYIKALLHPAGGHQGNHKAHQAGNQSGSVVGQPVGIPQTYLANGDCDLRKSAM